MKLAGRGWILRVLWIAFLSQWALDSNGAADTYDEALRRAARSSYAIEYDLAATQFEEAIRIQPENPRAYLYLASGYWMRTLYLQNSLLTTAFGLPADPYSAPSSTGSFPEFRAKFDDAIRRMKVKAQAMMAAQPQNPEGYFWLGMAEGSESVFIASVDKKYLAAKGPADRSFDLMEKAAKMDPSFKDPYFTMGMHMHLLGTRGFLTRVLLKMLGYRVSKEEGREYVAVAMREARFVRDDARLGLLLCHIREQNWKETLGLCQQVLQKYPEDSLLALVMGRIQSGMGDHAGAAATFREIVQRINAGHRGYAVLSPGEIHLRLALALLGTGQPQQALIEAEKAIQDSKAIPLVRAASHLTLGQARDLLKNRSGAVAAYQAAMAITPWTPSHEKARHFLNQPYDGKVPPG
jgi:tetratricopeptide (TPR) repeat protein